MEEIQLLLEMLPKTGGKKVMEKHPDFAFLLPSTFSPVPPIDPTLLETI